MNTQEDRKVLAQFEDKNGVLVKAPFDIPINPDLLQLPCITEVIKLCLIHLVTCHCCCNSLLRNIKLYVVFLHLTLEAK